MKTTILYKIALGAALVCLVISLIIIFSAGLPHAGPSLVAFLFLLGISFRGFDNLKGFTYSILIFAAVTMALYYPANFQEVDGFKLTNLITPLIQIIMFGMGTSMSAKDFVGVAKSPGAVGIGVVAQFSIMPSIGFLLASISGFPPEIAAGIVLIGCSPSGLASNVMSYLAKANLALDYDNSHHYINCPGDDTIINEVIGRCLH